MDALINLLAAVNVMLATALFVVNMARMDQRYAREHREEREYKSYFRERR